jgi:hypothetical protein
MLLILVAIAALALNITGRVLVLRTAGDLRGSWRTALACCPGADLVFAYFHFERARLGAGLCVLSVALAIPFTDEISSLVRGTPPAGAAAREHGQTDPNARVYFGMSATERARLLSFKETKVAELNRYLNAWHHQLAVRGTYLCDEMPELAVEFNCATAAYQSLLREWKTESLELTRLKDRM